MSYPVLPDASGPCAERHQEPFLRTVDDSGHEMPGSGELMGNLTATQRYPIFYGQGFHKSHQFDVQHRYARFEGMSHGDFVAVQEEVIRESHTGIDRHHGFHTGNGG